MARLVIGVISLMVAFAVLSVFGFIAFAVFEFIFSKFLYLIIGIAVLFWLFSK